MKALGLWLTLLIEKLIDIVFPPAKRLPIKYSLYDIIGYHENELKHLKHIITDKKVALDIGAFTGYYSYQLSKLFDQVVSFEINKSITKDLNTYNPGNIKIIHKGLSSTHQKSILYIPMLKGLAMPAWASLTPGNYPGTDKHLEIPVEIVPLDSFNLSPVSFIKIDVEGHELEVIKGARKTIQKNRPVLLIEVKSHNRQKCFQAIQELGYEEKKLMDLAGVPNSTENVIFYPKHAT